MDDLWFVAGSNVVIASLLGSLAFLVARRRMPALAHLLYVLALLKLVTPPVFDVELWAAQEVDVPAPLAYLDAVGPRLPETFGGGANASTVAAGVDASNVARASNVSSQSTESYLSGASVSVVALSLWGVGALLALLFAAVRVWRLEVWIRSLRRASSVVQREARGLARRLGLRRAPPVLTTESSVGPMLCSTTRGLRLVLPARLLATLSTDARATLLLHELAHVRRRDWLVRWLEVVVLALWWWLPIAYLIRRGLRRAEELCCDAWVVAELPERRASYAEALLRTTDLMTRTPSHASGMGPVRQLEERMTMFRSDHLPRSLGVTGRIVVFVVALLVLPVVACEAPVSVQEPQDYAHVVGAVKRPARLELLDGELTIFEAIATAEVAKNADLGRILLIRPGGDSPVILEVDFRRMIQRGDMTKNVKLAPNDIVYLQRRHVGDGILTNKTVIGKGDWVCCVVDKTVIMRPGAEQLAMLTQQQRIGPDGTILVPYVGPVNVLGKKTTEVEKLLEDKLQQFFNFEIQLIVRASHGK